MTNEDLELLSTEDLIKELLGRRNWAGVFIRTSEEFKGRKGTTQFIDNWSGDYRNMHADHVMKLLEDWISIFDKNRHTERSDY